VTETKEPEQAAQATGAQGDGQRCPRRPRSGSPPGCGPRSRLATRRDADRWLGNARKNSKPARSWNGCASTCRSTTTRPGVRRYSARRAADQPGGHRAGDRGCQARAGDRGLAVHFRSEGGVVPMLCPGCCALDDIPDWPDRDASQLKIVVGCYRCGFSFPVLPGEFKPLTLTAMHNHACSGRTPATGRQSGK